MNTYATYNIQDDKIRIYPAARLDEETYQRVKTAGYLWAPGQQCFYNTWTPLREDIAMELAGEIDDDSLSAEERAADRAERYEQHAQNAQERGDNAGELAHKLADVIPFGQPVLVGHYSESRDRAYRGRIVSLTDTACKEWDRAAYWKRRAATAAEMAEYKERADVVYRRIANMETERRKCEKYNNEHGRRWVEHLDMRLEYDRALYAKSGGIPADNITLEVGGAVLHFGKWREIIKVNKGRDGRTSSVSIPSGYSWLDKKAVDTIRQVMSKAEWAAYQQQ